MVCDKVVVDKVVCERWWVTKFFVREKTGGGGGGGGRRRRDTESKTRTPRKDVGNNMPKRRNLDNSPI